MLGSGAISLSTSPGCLFGKVCNVHAVVDGVLNGHADLSSMSPACPSVKWCNVNSVVDGVLTGHADLSSMSSDRSLVKV